MYVLWSSFKNSETDPSKISISIDDVTFMLGGRYIVADNKNVETKQYTRIKCWHLQTQIAEIRGYDKHQDIHLLLCKSFN